MNAQQPIATTPKYNFPLHNEHPQFPPKLIELSLELLKKTQHLEPLITNSTPHDHLSPSRFKPTAPTLNPIKLKPDTTKTPVVAIDVASINLGETETGTLLAIRGAIVWKHTDRYQYLRLGPFPFHISEHTQSKIYALFQHHHQAKPVTEYLTPNIFYMQTRLTTLLERWIQTSINQTTHDSLILWDGSLTAGTPETPVKTMARLLHQASDNHNTILAFSKMTRLLSHNHRITDFLWSHPPPCLLQMQSFQRELYSSSLRFMGKIYVAKLARGGCAFRLDVDRKLPPTHSVEAIQKLLGNDLAMYGYPETLRLAHIFSTFTATEVLGIQRWIAEEGNLRIVMRPNLRRLLFGRFGKGPEG